MVLIDKAGYNGIYMETIIISVMVSIAFFSRVVTLMLYILYHIA